MSLGSCRLCGLEELLPLFDVADKDGEPTEVRICVRCFAFTPRYTHGAITAAATTEHQASFHEAWWSETTAEEARALRTELGGLVREFRDLLGEPSPDRRIFDLGAGRGGLVAALRDAGYDARGCEPSAALAERGRKAFGLAPEHMVSTTAEEFLANVRKEPTKVGHVFLWHVIEHVADPLTLVRTIAETLPVGHCLFAQAPCLTEQGMYPEHLFFLTEPAIHALARNAACDVVRVSYDHKLGFVTFVLRRADRPIPSQWVPISSFQIEARAPLEVELPRVLRQLEEARAHGKAMVELADERARGIASQSTLIDERMKWIEDLQARLGRQGLELEQSRFAHGETTARLAAVEQSKAELERVIAELRDRIASDERRLVPHRVEKMLAKLSRNGR